MCELFAFSGKRAVQLNTYLREFTSHSLQHPDGWGLAVFYNDAVNLEKEPISAANSVYLRERLRHKIVAQNMVGHIRLASRGSLSYENSHPFVQNDDSKRTWTLIHNGTIFDSQILDAYKTVQEGQTDSERILCYIVDCMNQLMKTLKHKPNSEERFLLLDKIVQEIAPHNKLNLIIYDGELFYVHTNTRGTLYMKEIDEGIIFATVPLDKEEWKPVPFMQLLAFKNGEICKRGTKHTGEYVSNPDERVIQSRDFSCL